MNRCLLLLAAALALAACNDSDCTTRGPNVCSSREGYVMHCVADDYQEPDDDSSVAGHYEDRACTGLMPVCRDTPQGGVCEDAYPKAQCTTRVLATSAPAANGAVRVGDFTGDGKADVLLACSESEGASCGVHVLPQLEDGTLGAPIELGAYRGDERLLRADAADVDGDGMLDVVVFGSDFKHTRFDLFRAANGLAPSAHYEIEEGPFDVAALASFADVDGNGARELTVLGFERITVLAFREDELFELSRFDHDWARSNSTVTPVRLPGYERDVLLFAAGELTAMLDGFTGKAIEALKVPWPQHREHVAIGVDLDGDGFSELVRSDYMYGSDAPPTLTAIGLGHNGFAERASQPLATQLYDDGFYFGLVERTGDFDGDGLGDVLLLQGDSFSWLRGTPQAELAAVRKVEPDALGNIGLGYYDADHRTDVVLVGNDSYDAVTATVRLMEGTCFE